MTATGTEARKHGHYFKDVRHLDYIDIYRVLELFEVTDPCLQHAVKKLLVAGRRGVKGLESDVIEAVDSLNRFRQMRAENDNKPQSTTLEDGSVLTASPPPATEKPWYPDNSGEWVEVPDDCMECPVPIDTRIEYLMRSERAEMKYQQNSCDADAPCWRFNPSDTARVVAYKVVK